MRRIATFILWIALTVLPLQGQPGADTRPPTVLIVSPWNGARVSPLLTVTSFIFDNVGVTGAELWIDGKRAGGLWLWSYTWLVDTSLWTAGAHTLKVYAYDRAGNIGQSATVTVFK